MEFGLVIYYVTLLDGDLWFILIVCPVGTVTHLASVVTYKVLQ